MIIEENDYMFFVFEDFFIVFNHSPCTSFINDSIDVYYRTSQKYKIQVKVKYFSWSCVSESQRGVGAQGILVRQHQDGLQSEIYKILMICNAEKFL